MANMATKRKCIEFYDVFFSTFTIVRDKLHCKCIVITYSVLLYCYQIVNFNVHGAGVQVFFFWGGGLINMAE